MFLFLVQGPYSWEKVAMVSKFLTPRSMFWDFPSRSGKYSYPSPSPAWSHPADDQLNHSLSDLHLHPQQLESRSRMWRGGALMPAKGWPPSLQRPVAECPPLGLVQKWVLFDLTNDLGDAPSLPTDLANFLGENITNEQIDTPCPFCSLDWRSPTAALWQWLPALFHPYRRSSTKIQHYQAHSCHLSWAPA